MVCRVWVSKQRLNDIKRRTGVSKEAPVLLLYILPGPATKIYAVVKLVPGLNHLLQSCTTCTTDEYSKLSEDFSPIVIRQVIDFIKSR